MAGKDLSIGIDIGGTHTKIGIVDEAGNILEYQKIRSELEEGMLVTFLADIKDQVNGLFRKHDNVRGIGISLLGPINEEQSGSVFPVNAPILHGVNLKAAFESVYRLPVLITNDLTAHALAEHYFGVGKDIDRFMTLAVGTGLGAGVIINGQPVRIWGGTAGDTGRIILQPNADEICGGKVHGSAEALCGTAGIEKLALLRYGKRMPCHEIIKAAREGRDPIASEIMQEIGGHLGHLLAIIAVIFFPFKIALTGGTIEAGPVLIDSCRTQFKKMVGDYFELMTNASNGYFKNIEICKGSLGAEAAMIGAAARLFKENPNSIEKTRK